MKISILTVSALTILLGAGTAAAQSSFTATIDEGQANAGAGTGSTASGAASMTLTGGTILSYSIALSGVDLDGAQTPGDTTDDVTALHFHAAAAGVNGPVVFGLIGPNHDVDDLTINAAAGTLTGAWEDTDTNPLTPQLANLMADGLYINVHTTSFPAGEIRGQVTGVARVVPTTNQIGLALLALLLAAVGFVALRRRRTV